MRLARARRAACDRFSEAYWEADDELAWLRMVRDEIGRTGHARTEIQALLLATGTGVPVAGGVPAVAERSGQAELPAGVVTVACCERQPAAEESTLIARLA